MMVAYKNNDRGMTLVELIISVGIISIIVFAVGVQLREFLSFQKSASQDTDYEQSRILLGRTFKNKLLSVTKPNINPIGTVYVNSVNGKNLLNVSYATNNDYFTYRTGASTRRLFFDNSTFYVPKFKSVGKLLSLSVYMSRCVPPDNDILGRHPVKSDTDGVLDLKFRPVYSKNKGQVYCCENGVFDPANVENSCQDPRTNFAIKTYKLRLVPTGGSDLKVDVFEDLVGVGEVSSVFYVGFFINYRPPSGSSSEIGSLAYISYFSFKNLCQTSQFNKEACLKIGKVVAGNVNDIVLAGKINQHLKLDFEELPISVHRSLLDSGQALRF